MNLFKLPLNYRTEPTTTTDIRFATREAFTFDPVRNCFICPEGKLLKHRTVRIVPRIYTLSGYSQ